MFYLQVFYTDIDEARAKLRSAPYVAYKRDVLRTFNGKSSMVTMLEVYPPINDTSVVSFMDRLLQLELPHIPEIIYGQSIENNPELEKFNEPEVILKYARIDFDCSRVKVLDTVIIPELHIKNIHNITADMLKPDIPIAFGLHNEVLNKPYLLDNLSYKAIAINCKDIISILPV